MQNTGHRRSIRLHGYDYAQPGAYFVTICVQNRECLFGDVVDGVMRLNQAGQMVHMVWKELSAFYPGTEVDAYIIMPNHIHGIIVLVGATPCGRPDMEIGRPDMEIGRPNMEIGRPDIIPPSDMGRAQGPDGRASGIGQPRGVAPTLTLPDVIHRFKTMTTKRYADGVKQSAWPPFAGRLWQRNYYEHIIRNEESLNRIREYITNNPLQWALDRENPVNVGVRHVSPAQRESWENF